MASSVLLLLAFAQDLFGDQARKRLRAALRAAGTPRAAMLEAKGLALIPDQELYAAAVERFSKKLSEASRTPK
jgi:hypothetical protein